MTRPAKPKTHLFLNDKNFAGISVSHGFNLFRFSECSKIIKLVDILSAQLWRANRNGGDNQHENYHIFLDLLGLSLTLSVAETKK